MTVGQKLHQALVSLEGAKSNLESFALETQDKNAQKMYADSANQVNQVIQSLEGRVNYVEQQEPQHKVFQQMQNQDKDQQ